MPWKESSVMEERLCFVARLLDGEPMTEVCRDFGISRKTGYKIFDRYNEHGLAGPHRSFAPARALRQPAPAADRKPDRQPQAQQTALGRTQNPRASGPPPGRRCQGSRQKHHPRRARSPWPGQTNAAKPRNRAHGTPLSEGAAPNDLWCADFKGEFKLGNGRYCYPLTVTDHASRFVLLCEALEFDP